MYTVEEIYYRLHGKGTQAGRGGLLPVAILLANPDSRENQMLWPM